MDKGKTGNQIIAFLAGAVVGAAAGILFAPDEGASTRNKLSYQLDRLKTALEEAINDLIKEKEKAINSARNEGNEVTDDVIAKAERLMDEVNELTQKFKSGNK